MDSSLRSSSSIYTSEVVSVKQPNTRHGQESNGINKNTENKISTA